MKKHCKMISVESLRYLAHFLPDGEKLISLPRQFPNKNIVTKRSGSETPLLQNQVKLCPLLHNFVFRQVFLKPATGHNSRSSRIAMKDQRRSSIIRKLGEWHSWLAGVPSRHRLRCDGWPRGTPPSAFKRRTRLCNTLAGCLPFSLHEEAGWSVL